MATEPIMKGETNLTDALAGSMFDLQTHAKSIRTALHEADSYLMLRTTQPASTPEAGFGEREGQSIGLLDFSTGDLG